MISLHPEFLTKDGKREFAPGEKVDGANIHRL